MQDILQKSYDEIPYQADVHPSTHPIHLRTIASFFGVKSKSPKQARVLEIGCAGGANIFAMAKELPKASLIGIEFSKEQVQLAKKTIVSKAIKNVEIQQLDILKVSKEFGKFDYIVAHGIYSWVPADVREKIFQIFAENLNTDGLAYLSYNTLPGWHLRGMLREQMLLVSSGVADSKQRLENSRKSLALMANIIPNGPLKECLLPEIKSALAMPDWYLAHDYLEAHNVAFSFKDICETAARFNLNYVADADLVKALPQQISAQSRHLIDSFSEDRLMRECLYDYVHVRMLRRSIFCSGQHPVSITPQINVVRNCLIKTELFKDSAEPGLYRHPNGGAVNCSKGVLADALAYLLSNPNKSVSYQDIHNFVCGRDNPEYSKELEASLVRLYFADMLNLSLIDS